MNERPQMRWGKLQWGVAGGVVVLACLLGAAMVPGVARHDARMKGVSNCRQIIIALKQYSKDNCSAYPDTGPGAADCISANDVFRRLFQEQILTDEYIFVCPNSVFAPDGEIGKVPRFSKALAPGECHWMLAKGLTDTSPGEMPVVVENALNAAWPLKWDVSGQAGNRKGRAWKGRVIILGRNDGSAAVEELNEEGTPRRDPDASREAGRPAWRDTLKYWEVEEKEKPSAEGMPKEE